MGALTALRLRLFCAPTPRSLPSFVLLSNIRMSCVRSGHPVRLWRLIWLDLARFGSPKRCCFVCFGGPTAVRTRNARPLPNTGRAQSNRGSGVPRATPNRPKIALRAPWERMSEHSARNSRFASSRVLFSDAPGSPGGTPRHSQSAPGAFRSRPGASRERPGASFQTPESPKVPPMAPESDLASIWLRFCSIA